MEVLKIFADIFKYITNPFAFYAFIAMVFGGIGYYLISKNLLSKLNKKDSAKYLKGFTLLFFIICILLIIVGTFLKYIEINNNHQIESQKETQKNNIEELSQLNSLVKSINSNSRFANLANDEQIQALKNALTLLIERKINSATDSQVSEAINELKLGRIDKTKDIFIKEVKNVEYSIKKSAEFYRYLGAVSFWEDFQESIHAYKRATELDSDNSDGWNKLGFLYRLTNKKDSALYAFTKVLDLGVKNNNKEEMAIAYGNIGTVYHIKNDLQHAEEFYKKSLEINTTLNRRQGIASAYQELGLLYLDKKNIDYAKEMFMKSLIIEESLEDNVGKAVLFGNMGTLYLEQNDTKQAEEMYTKSIDLYMKFGNKEGVAKGYNNLGNLYMNQKNYDQAILHYKKSLSIYEKYGDTNFLRNIYANLSIIYFEQGNTDEGTKLFHLGESLQPKGLITVGPVVEVH